MVKRSKKYRESLERIDSANLYSPTEAIELLKTLPAYGFDQSVEAVYRLNVDPRKADQLVRGTVNLPNGKRSTSKPLNAVKTRPGSIFTAVPTATNMCAITVSMRTRGFA